MKKELFSGVIKSLLSEIIDKSNLESKFDDIYIKALGKPPYIDKNHNLIDYPELPDIEILSKLARINSNIKK